LADFGGLQARWLVAEVGQFSEYALGRSMKRESGAHGTMTSWAIPMVRIRWPKDAGAVSLALGNSHATLFKNYWNRNTLAGSADALSKIPPRKFFKKSLQVVACKSREGCRLRLEDPGQ